MKNLFFLTVILIHHCHLFSQNNNDSIDSQNIKHSLVISGGGSRGAWGVGVLKGLAELEGYDYEYVVGTSTGSLMGPLVLTGHFDKLATAYTSVSQDDIFNRSPFNKKGKLKKFNFIWRMIRGKSSIGETDDLRVLIQDFFTEDIYNEIKNKKKIFGASVTSLTKNTVKVKDTENYGYEDMIDWIWASSSIPIFMNLVEKEDQEWADGGLKEYIPISYVMKKNTHQIDVIVHSTAEVNDTTWLENGIGSILVRSTDINKNFICRGNIRKALFLRERNNKNIKIIFYFMPEDLIEKTKNSLLFDKKTMSELLEKGYNSVMDKTIDKVVFKLGEEGCLIKESANKQ